MNFEDATNVECLYYYDFPLISHYRHEGKDYLLTWVDVEVIKDKSDPPALQREIDSWLWMEIAETTLAEFKANQITLLECYERSPAIYAAKGAEDQDLGSDWENAELIAWADVPDMWRPTKDSFLRWQD